MPECESCGARVEMGVRECPYCGHSTIEPTIASKTGTIESRTYSLDKESGTIHFGDGERGARPESGRDIGSDRPRTGFEPTGDVVCPNCKHKNPVPRGECEACGTPLRDPVPRRQK